MARRPLDSPLAIVVLGLLAEQPLHPYGMRVLMRDRGHDRIVGRGPASLYDAMTRFAAAGLVEVQESQQTGRRPERTVYRLTSTGLTSLQTWVRKALAEAERGGQFSAALSFMYVLPESAVVELLTTRLAALEELIRVSESAFAEAVTAGVPPIFLSEGRYSHALLEAERDWLAAFITQLDSDELRWPRATHEPELPT